MGITDDVRAYDGAAHLTDEVLYAEALREVEQGIRRDGLWAKALSESQMEVKKAQALYLKFRVQSLRAEFNQLIAQKSQERQLRIEAEERVAHAERQQHARQLQQYRDRPVTLGDWRELLAGAAFVIVLILIGIGLLCRFKAIC